MKSTTAKEFLEKVAYEYLKVLEVVLKELNLFLMKYLLRACFANSVYCLPFFQQVSFPCLSFFMTKVERFEIHFLRTQSLVSHLCATLNEDAR